MNCSIIGHSVRDFCLISENNMAKPQESTGFLKADSFLVKLGECTVNNFGLKYKVTLVVFSLNRAAKRRLRRS